MVADGLFHNRSGPPVATLVFTRKLLYMKKLLTSFILAASLSGTVCAADAPLWLRDTRISPDGKTIAFTYKGNIFTVGVSGGESRQLTSGGAYDSTPIWSPDGSKIAFRSNRLGSDDVFIVDAKGGTPRRVTTDSGRETPVDFLDENTLVYFSAGIPGEKSAVGPFGFPLPYVVDLSMENPRPRLMMSVPMTGLSVSPSGKMLYADKKGYENFFRKHERSSGTYDIWMIGNGEFTKLTDFNGHDMYPVWAPDEASFYYVSEEDGTLNVYRKGIDGSGKKQLTFFEKHPVRMLSAAKDGTLAFSWDGEIYTMREGEQPKKVNVSITVDDFDNDLVKRIVNGGASNYAVAPSGNEVAVVLRGEVYVTDSKYKTTRRITDTPWQERNVSFSPDGRTLVYDSDRDGYWQLFTAKIKNPDEKRFAYASEIEEELLYKSPTSAQQPVFSPDGKKVAFLENRSELKVIDVDTKKVVTALPGKFNYSYEDGDIPFCWSPDSQWLLISYIGDGGWNNSDVAAVRADGSEVVNLSESGFSNGNPKWALDGKAVTFTTSKYGMKNPGSWGTQQDIVLMALDGEAWDNFLMTEEEAGLAEEAEKVEKEKESKDNNGKDSKKKDKKKGKADSEKKESSKKSDLEFADGRYRQIRLTDVSTLMGDYWLNKKGDKLYYTAVDPTGEMTLYMEDLKKNETSPVMSGVQAMEADAAGDNLFLITRGGGLTKMNLASGTKEPVAFEADYDRKPSAEREYIYSHMLRQVNDKFYDVNLHGVDWEYYGDHYRQFLPHIGNDRDFADLLSEILGELNASHTGAKCFAGDAELEVADLGAYFDDSYDGAGLKVSSVMPRGPLSRRNANVAPGDIILAIDGKEIVKGADYSSMLEGKAGRPVSLRIRKADGKEVTSKVKPITPGRLRQLAYERWVENNERVVDSVSGGKIGYVHVKGMDGDSFRTIYERILGKYRNCDAIVVDTRYNGGGWLHNDLAILLSGKEYVNFSPRGQFIGHEPFSQWTKPSVMLVCEGNYSDAHGSPYTYQTLGIGDIVGAPIPGTMTAVWWENQINPMITFGIPQVTSLDLNGRPLENQQLNPDLIIYNEPGALENGVDNQLIEATKHLLRKTAK